ncbi:MAG: protein translocase subunit SecF, partial [FCB group bacterium]|nr:protein translocase subunit SecF [FCB group bacterium]
MFELIKNVNIDFLGKRKLASMVSGLVILAGLVSLVLHGGPLYSIDFEGGTEIQVLFTKATDVESVRSALSDIGYGDAAIRGFGNDNEILIHVKTSTQSEEQVNIIREALASINGADGYDVRRLETVGPKIGKELRGDMISAVLIAMAGIVIYISIRFQFKYAIGALVALVHDVLITLGLFSLLNIEISLSVLAAFLFIVGYSLNDTIVVFDRVRENAKEKRHDPFISVLNLSLNQTLNRTIITS